MNIETDAEINFRKNTCKIIDIFKQWDRDSRTMQFKIFEETTEQYLNIDANDCRVIIAMTKPDGNQVFNDCTVEDNTIIVEFTEQMLAAPGIAHAELRIYDTTNDTLCITSTFQILINDSAVDDFLIQSSYEYNALTTIILTMDTYLEKTESTLQEAEDTAEALQKTNEEYIANEQARVEAENARVAAENSRVEAENAREAAEAARVEAENARVEAENARETAFDDKIDEVDECITESNEATASAEGIVDTIKQLTEDLPVYHPIPDEDIEEAFNEYFG